MKVLFVAPYHPRVRGGAVGFYIGSLYAAAQASEAIEPLLVARTGPPLDANARPHEGTLFSAASSGDPNQYVLHTNYERLDRFLVTTRSKGEIAQSFRGFIAALRPEVVHFHDLALIGVEAIREVRNVLPEAVIVYAPFGYDPICHREGLLVRATNERPCDEESPRRCHECFPRIHPREFFLRKRFVQSHLNLLDMLVAPSRFVRDRYLEWGVPPDRVRVEENGVSPMAPIAARDDAERRRLGFFGSLEPAGGIKVLLEAAQRLMRDGVPLELWVHGTDFDQAPEPFRAELEALLEPMRDRVNFEARLDPAEVARLMARVDWVVVPSLWWEAWPAAIHHAFMANTPVICSDIGTMSEKVTDGVDGLHFRAGDSHSLAETIRRAVENPGLWTKLREGIHPPPTIEEHLDSLVRLYTALREERRAPRPTAAQVQRVSPA